MSDSKDKSNENKSDGLEEVLPNTGNHHHESNATEAGERSITSDPETPSDEVNERDQEIQEEKIHDVSEKNDTMHNPAMNIGKSYVVTTDDIKDNKEARDEESGE